MTSNTTNNFEVRRVAETILINMMKFNMAFGAAWNNYNETWHNGELTAEDKEETRLFISKVFDEL